MSHVYTVLFENIPATTVRSTEEPKNNSVDQKDVKQEE